MATVIRSTSPTSSTPARATRSSLPDPSELAPPKRQVLRKKAAARDSSRAVALLRGGSGRSPQHNAHATTARIGQREGASRRLERRLGEPESDARGTRLGRVPPVPAELA